MPQYTVSRGAVSGVTSAATTDLIAIEPGTNRAVKIIEVGWGGEQTSSLAMRTRLTYATTAGTITGTPDVLKQNPATDPTISATTGTADGSATLGAGSLIPFSSWNAHGGVVRWLAGPGEEFMAVQAVSGGKQFVLRNEVGVATITCGIVIVE